MLPYFNDVILTRQSTINDVGEYEEKGEPRHVDRRLALRRPYTFIVMALLIVMLGVASIRQTPTDIFPEHRHPRHQRRLDLQRPVHRGDGAPDHHVQRVLHSFAVTDIKRIESQTLNGVAVIKIYFQPDVDIASATAQVTGVAQTILRRMPPGTTPPFIVRYNASSVPILQMSLSSDRHSEAELYDYGIYRIRKQLGVVQGTTFPLPYGGTAAADHRRPRPREAPRLRHRAAGRQHRHQRPEPDPARPAPPRSASANTPSASTARPTASRAQRRAAQAGRTAGRSSSATWPTVHDGFAVQTQVVRENGRRGVLLTVLKNGNSLDARDRQAGQGDAPRDPARRLPEGMKIELLTDQSRFVDARRSTAC